MQAVLTKKIKFRHPFVVLYCDILSHFFYVFKYMKEKTVLFKPLEN